MLKILMILGLVSAANAISCEEARRNCAYRTGCGNALAGYQMGCTAELHTSPPNRCPKTCQKALISLMSSDEGKDLMSCECTDDECTETKQRVEVCRPYVMRAVNEERPVTCEIAQLICTSDAACLKALEYYHQNCEPVFSGRKCTRKCKNSIAVLRKQEKAAKLNSCRCSGEEEYDCPRIRANIAKLCFNKVLAAQQQEQQILTDSPHHHRSTFIVGHHRVDNDHHHDEDDIIDDLDVNRRKSIDTFNNFDQQVDNGGHHPDVDSSGIDRTNKDINNNNNHLGSDDDLIDDGRSSSRFHKVGDGGNHEVSSGRNSISSGRNSSLLLLLLLSRAYSLLLCLS